MFGLLSFKNPRYRLLFVSAVSILLVACLMVAGYSFLQYKKNLSQESDNLVIVPALVGRNMPHAQAKANLAYLKLEVDKWIASKVYPVGHVVSQKPLPGVKVKKSEKIIVKVSGGRNYCGSGYEQDSKVSIVDDQKPLPDPPIQPRKVLSDKVVVLDPGHQSRANLSREPIGPGATETKEKVQGGTRGIKSKTPEYQITLEISKKLKEILELNGIKTVMIRETNDVDISNVERAQLANNSKADLFVRIHADGNVDQKKNGISTLYPAKNKWTESIFEDSLSAASIIHKSLIETSKHADNGLVARGDITGFNWSKVPVVLVEVGFLTNSEEDLLLNDERYQRVVASGIANGVAEYLQSVKK